MLRVGGFQVVMARIMSSEILCILCYFQASINCPTLQRSLLSPSLDHLPVFCDVAPYCLVEIGRRFRGVHYRHHQGDDHMLGAVSISAAYVSLYQTTRCIILEDNYLHLQILSERQIVQHNLINKNKTRSSRKNEFAYFFTLFNSTQYTKL